MSFFSKRNKDKHNDKAAKLQDAQQQQQQQQPANPPMNFGQQPAPNGGSMPRATSFDRMPNPNGGLPPQNPGGRDSPSQQMGGPGGFGAGEREMGREQLSHQQAAQEQRKVSGSQQPPMSGGVHQIRKPVSLMPGPPPPAPSEIQFPWTQRRLTLPHTPPPGGPTPTPHLTPFPRYGLSTPPNATAGGSLFLFGGLVSDSVRNDLFMLDCKTLALVPVMGRGEVPVPRVGHATGMVGNVLISWGGDTKTRADEEQDQGLYLLNTANFEWSRIVTEPDQMPAGRYGHAVCMHRNRFFVFGGQVDMVFFDDLWCFDLNSIKTQEGPRWDRITPVNDPPRARTGHVCVTFQDRILLFGGTDGEFHYNDTWSYHIPTREWTELECIGYLPVAREGHAATVVGDVVYIFGGRDVNGQDLGDLAAFKISTKRWFMFQNMGPAPGARSGHAMASYADKVLVLGGEAIDGTPDNPTLIHVLDTAKIKYPKDPSRPPGQNPVHRKSSAPVLNPNQQQMTPAPPRAASAQGQSQANRAPMSPPEPLRALSPTGTDRAQSKSSGLPPMRPRREGDEIYGVGDPNRAKSPAASGQLGDATSSRSPIEAQRPARTTSATNSPTQRDFSRHGLPNGVPLGPELSVGRDSPAGTLSPGFSPTSISNGQMAKSQHMPSQLRDGDVRSPSPSATDPALQSSASSSFMPPADAFYQPRSPTIASAMNSVSGHGRQGSLSGIAGADLMREMKAREVEIDGMKRRERWLKAELARAAKAGFAVQSISNEPTLALEDFGSEESDARKLADALIGLKKERARLQTELTAQDQRASQRFLEAERTQQAAIQEAAFYRAKMLALEANAPADFARLERDRSAELERSLGLVGSEHESLQRQLAQLKETVDLEKQLRLAAEEREGEAVRRATSVERDHAQTTDELHDLHEKHAQAESALRDYADRMLAHESTIQQHLVDLTATRSMHDEVLTSRDGHVRVLAELQIALQHSGGRATEAESLYQSERSRADELEGEVENLRRELDTRSREADAATARLADVESSWSRSREEADSLRLTTTGGLAALLAHHSQFKADHVNSIRGHEDKVQAMDQEASSLRKMLREAGIRIDESQAALGEQRRRARQIEQEHGAFRSEVQVARSSLSVALADTGRLREQLATREAEVKDAQSAVSELEVRLAMMRGLLADSGIAVNEDDLHSEESVPSHRLRDVESKLSEKAQQHEETERELDLSQRRIEMAEAKVADLNGQLEALKSRVNQDGVLSPTPDSLRQLESRAEIAEKQLKDTLASKTQIESDYQTAVQYVKTTDKLLRRYKDENVKIKAQTSSLQGELDAIRGTNSSEAGSRTREVTGRNTPTIDESPESLRKQLVDSQRQLYQLNKISQDNQALTAESADLRAEVAKLKDAYTQELDESHARVTDLEKELLRLQQAAPDVRRLKTDLAAVRSENAELRQRVQHLLDSQEYDGDEPRAGSSACRRGSLPVDDDDDLDHAELQRYIRSQSPPSGVAGPTIDARLAHERQ